MFKSPSLFPFFLAAGTVVAHAQQVHTDIGRAATPKQIQSYGISIAPDGTGLPAGHGTALQGRSIYMASCAACHGKRGQGITGMPALVGGYGTLTTDKPFATVNSYWPLLDHALGLHPQSNALSESRQPYFQSGLLRHCIHFVHE